MFLFVKPSIIHEFYERINSKEMPINKLLEYINDCCKSKAGVFKFRRSESHKD